GDPFLGPRFLHYARNSFVLAGSAAVLVVATGALVAYAARLAPGAVTATAIRIASIGYAVPGTVIAVGILVPLGAFDNALDGWTKARFGW
ncbi:hypothetical protein ABTJ99_20005, partial [Acinetobacter baumannii]